MRVSLQWLPGRTWQVINGGKPQPLTADLVIMNYQIVGKHLDALLARPWRGLVIDEAHNLKNKKAQQTIACAEVAALESLEMVTRLTGTPILNRPNEFKLRLTDKYLDKPTTLQNVLPLAMVGGVQ